MLGEEHGLGDLAVRHALRDEIEDPALLGRQRCELGVTLRRRGQALDDLRDQLRVEQGLATCDAMDVADEIARLDLLEHVPSRASHHARKERFIVSEAGEHETRELRHRGAQLAAHLDTAAILEADVKDCDVRLGEWDPHQRVGSGGRLAHDLDVRVAFQQDPDALANQVVVVQQEDSDRHAAIVPAPMAVGATRSSDSTVLGSGLVPCLTMPFARIEDPELLRRLMAAVLMIGEDIELPVLLRSIVEEACSLVGARYGALGVLNESRTALEEFVTVGLSPEEERAIGVRPTGRGVLGALITDPATLRLEDLHRHPESYGFPPGHPPMTSFLGVPVRVRATGRVFGNLYLTDKGDDQDFDDQDEAMVETLALAAGIAIENTRLHDRVRVLSVLDDRDRIAMALHDNVIQRLFASGLALQSAVRLLDRDAIVERIAKVIDDLDGTITEIRGTIFELGRSDTGGFHESVRRLLDELTPMLGGRPVLSCVGRVDETIAGHLGDHVLAVVRESLTNASKHADARHFEVVLRVDDTIAVEVLDDGVGIDLVPPASRGLGLNNLRRRATRLGGTFDVRRAEGGGTRVVWSVPLESA